MATESLRPMVNGVAETPHTQGIAIFVALTSSLLSLSSTSACCHPNALLYFEFDVIHNFNNTRVTRYVLQKPFSPV